jgi:hypothetical protein
VGHGSGRADDDFDHDAADLPNVHVTVFRRDATCHNHVLR